MAIIEFSLPDDLADDADALGLFEPEIFEALVRNWLMRQKANATDSEPVHNAPLTCRPELTAIWNNPDDDAYDAL